MDFFQTYPSLSSQLIIMKLIHLKNYTEVRHGQLTVNTEDKRRGATCLQVQIKSIETWKHSKNKRVGRSRRDDEIRLLAICYSVSNLNLEHVNVLHCVENTIFFLKKAENKLFQINLMVHEAGNIIKQRKFKHTEGHGLWGSGSS